MPISEGLRTSLNQIRETSVKNGTVYSKQIDEISPNTDITAISSPLLSDTNLMNEFFDILVKRIMYTQVVIKKLFNNPLKFLEGTKMPLGSIGQEIFINPAKGRRFDANDFAGLLAKYEADVKVQYPHMNSDIQYPVTATKAKIKNAFTSWANLEEFINGLSQSLYNGCYIDRYNFTKGLVASAYRDNAVKVEVVEAPTTQELAEDFLVKARTYFLNMQDPSPDHNAWRQVGGYGRDVLTWSDPEDIVFLIRNDIGAFLDVKVLSKAFNIDSAKLLGRVKYVKDFTERDKDGNVVVDGSKIVAMMCDNSWFRIKNQDTTMDEFFNPNNRSLQIYLNDENMYQYSLFANAICFATEQPNVEITKMEFAKNNMEVLKDEVQNIRVSTTPASANNPEITYNSNNENIIIEKISDKEIKVKGKVKGTSIITATAGNVTTKLNVTISE